MFFANSRRDRGPVAPGPGPRSPALDWVSLDTDVRHPAVAGRFYPGDPQRLAAELERLLAGSGEPVRARALLAPHAGYVYSGAVAGATFAGVQVPERVIVLGPNHTGRGAARSLWPRGSWLLPGGAVPIDAELGELAVRHAGLVPDRDAHLFEHAIEVELPFLRARTPGLRVVPICLSQLPYSECERIGTGIARAIAELGCDVLIVASTDMSHYVSAFEARAKDMLALERVLALDARGLHRTVSEHGISMCGYVPSTVALVAACALGASSARLVRYANSGDVSGDLERVVGYAGVIVS